MWLIINNELEEFVLEVPRKFVLEYSIEEYLRSLDWNIYYVHTYFVRVQHNRRAAFVLQDRHCRLLAHVIRLE
jgi:predicted nuclease of restriction endonuclease-like (RecB) superfamily